MKAILTLLFAFSLGAPAVAQEREALPRERRAQIQRQADSPELQELIKKRGDLREKRRELRGQLRQERQSSAQRTPGERRGGASQRGESPQGQRPIQSRAQRRGAQGQRQQRGRSMQRGRRGMCRSGQSQGRTERRSGGRVMRQRQLRRR